MKEVGLKLVGKKKELRSLRANEEALRKRQRREEEREEKKWGHHDSQNNLKPITQSTQWDPSTPPPSPTYSSHDVILQQATTLA